MTPKFLPKPLRRQILRAVGCAALLIASPALAQDAKPAAEPVKRDVIYVPTPQAAVDRMLEMAKVTKDDYVVDLGSGDGRIPITAAQKYGARAYGVDIDPQRIREANDNLRKAGVGNLVRFEQADLFKTTFTDANVLTLYLLTSLNLRLKPIILSEMKPGTRVVSHSFAMGRWEPDQSDTVNGSRLYLWVVPARVDGRWTFEDGGTKYDVTLKQEFQTFTGEGTAGGKPAKITEGRLSGNTITFTLAREGEAARTLTGTVDGNGMTDNGGAWKASRSAT